MISFPGVMLKTDTAGAAAPAQGDTAAGFLTALLQAKGVDASALGPDQLAELLRDAQDLPLDGMLAQPLPAEGSPEALLALMLGAQQVELGEATPGEAKPGEQAALAAVGGGRAQGRGGLDMLLTAGQAQPQVVAGAEAFQGLLQVGTELKMNPLSAPAAAAAAQPIPVPVGDPGWGQAVGERLVWAVKQHTQHATIRLDPPHLGPLEIAVSIKDDQASVTIQAHHALTREALEAEMPRLRAMLGDSGFTSVDVNVARDQNRQPGEGALGGAGGSEAAASEGEGEGSEAVGSSVTLNSGNGLLDHYA